MIVFWDLVWSWLHEARFPRGIQEEAIISSKSRKIFMKDVTCQLDIQDYTARLETTKEAVLAEEYKKN